jgi:hypothetical protein
LIGAPAVTPRTLAARGVFRIPGPFVTKTVKQACRFNAAIHDDRMSQGIEKLADAISSLQHKVRRQAMIDGACGCAPSSIWRRRTIPAAGAAVALGKRADLPWTCLE